MRSLLLFLVTLAAGVLVGVYMIAPRFYRSHVTPPMVGSCNPKEVHVGKDHRGSFMLAANQKFVHLSLSNHEVVAWTIDHDATIDSVTALFGSGSPFAHEYFSFADSAAFSGLPTVRADTTTYHYTLTVYPHGHAPITVDPGIIVDM